MATSVQLKPTRVEVPLKPVIQDGTPVQASEISVIVEGPTSVAASVAPKGSDVAISFTTTVPGDYKLIPTARGQALQHTPVTVQVKEGRPEDARLPPPPPIASYPVRFEVDANDADGKPLPANSDLKIDVQGPEQVRATHSRMPGNRLLLQFESTRQHGSFTVHVSYQGRPIERSPFELTLSGKSSTVSEEVVRLPSLPKTRPIQFSVPAIGPSQRPVRAADLVASIANGPERNAVCTVADGTPGNLLVTIEVGTPGKYEVAVKVCATGTQIEGSTFDIEVPPAAFQK